MPYTEIWRAVEPYMRFRRNDVHVPICYHFAEMLVDTHPNGDRDVVLLGILLHDIGWAFVDQQEMYATAFKKDITPVRIQHEKEGAQVAREVLMQHGYPQPLIDEVASIIDGHDTRKETLSLNDSLVKDADKLWRFTPTGIAFASEWLETTPAGYVHKLKTKDIHLIFNDAARKIAQVELEKSKTLLRIADLPEPGT